MQASDDAVRPCREGRAADSDERGRVSCVARLGLLIMLQMLKKGV